jgi:thiol-disulfide isomerase/thioredoxin
MIHRFLAACLGLGMVLTLSFAQEKKEGAKSDSATDRKAEYEKIFGEFKAERQKAIIAMRSAKTPEEQKAIKLPQEADYVPRLVKLLDGAGNDKDEVALDALTMAFYGFESTNPRVLETLDKNFAKSPKIEQFVGIGINANHPALPKFLEKVLASNESKKIQGMACYALASKAFEDDKAKEATAYFERIEKEFADVTIGKRNLADMAKGSLFELRNLQVGMPAPEAASKNLKGDAVKLSDLKGKVVVLDIWATWCGPCRAMIPHERELVEKMKEKPFTFISVSADETKEELEKFIKDEPMPWTHWWDGSEAKLLKDWNIRFFPTIYVIDAKGIIRFKNVRGKDLDNAVEKLVAEAK